MAANGQLKKKKKTVLQWKKLLSEWTTKIQINEFYSTPTPGRTHTNTHPHTRVHYGITRQARLFIGISVQPPWGNVLKSAVFAEFADFFFFVLFLDRSENRISPSILFDCRNRNGAKKKKRSYTKYRPPPTFSKIPHETRRHAERHCFSIGPISSVYSTV